MYSNTSSNAHPMRYDDRSYHKLTPAYHHSQSRSSLRISLTPNRATAFQHQPSDLEGFSGSYQSHVNYSLFSTLQSPQLAPQHSPYFNCLHNDVPITDAYTDWQSADGTLPFHGYDSQGLVFNSEMQGYFSSAQSSPLFEYRRATITHSTPQDSHICPSTSSPKHRPMYNARGKCRKIPSEPEPYTTGRTLRTMNKQKGKASNLKFLKWHEEDPAAGIQKKQRRTKDVRSAPPSASHETIAVEFTPPEKQQTSDTRRKRAEVFKKKRRQIISTRKILYKKAFNILKERQSSSEQHSFSGENSSSKQKYFESSDLLEAWMLVMDCGVSTYWLGPPWWLQEIEYTTEIGELTEKARKTILQHLICGEHSQKVSLGTLEILHGRMRAVNIHEEGRKALEKAMAFHRWELKAKDPRLT